MHQQCNPKFKCVPFKSPREMIDQEFFWLSHRKEIWCRRQSWTRAPCWSLGTYQWYYHFTFWLEQHTHLKAFSTYGMIVKSFQSLTAYMNYAIKTNHLLSLTSSVTQRLWKLQEQSVTQWVDDLWNAFSGGDFQWTYQGDGYINIDKDGDTVVQWRDECRWGV